MQVYVDGQLKIRGKDAFCKPAAEPTPFLLFGSNSKGCTGEAYWDCVKVGVRSPKGPAEKQELKVTLSEPYGILRSTDQGKTWTHFSTIARGDEPGVARISELEWTALLRQDSWAPLHQVWSHDGGKTWSEPTVLEEGSVDSDVTVMHDGVLAASYGRPGCNVMLSTDRGKTWGCHRSITLEGGFNYTTLCEVRPGRLLYVHDAPPLTALYIDVERVGPTASTISRPACDRPFFH
jgi:hypothetical protein